MKRLDNVALVVQGGATRGIFAGGALDVLMQEGIDIPYVVGTSAGALTLMGYLSGEEGKSKTMISTLMGDKKFVSLNNYIRKGSFFNFDYAFKGGGMKKIGWNVAAFESSPKKMFVGTSCLESGKAEYLEKKPGENFYPCIAASSSLPLISKPVEINGKHYLDGGTTCPIPFRKPLEDGIEKIVVISTRDKSFRKGPMKRAYTRHISRKFKEFPAFTKAYRKENENYNKDFDYLYELEKQGRVFVIAPLYPLDVPINEKDKDELNRVYNRGVDETWVVLPKLKEYLGI